jgi:hypothetical protein
MVLIFDFHQKGAVAFAYAARRIGQTSMIQEMK